MITKRRAFLVVAIIFILFSGYFLDLKTAPVKAPIVDFPFKDDQCLTYEQYFHLQQDESTNSKVCFQLDQDGFIEVWDGRTTTYDSHGFANLSVNDIESWKNVLGEREDKRSFAQNYLFDSIADDLNYHNIFYGPPDLSIGYIFYNGHKVKEFSEYNGESVYVVENSSWEDTRLTDKGIISKVFWRIMFDYNRLVFEPTQREGSSNDLIERLYYSRTTGILQGIERIWVVRDKNGNVLSSESPLKFKNNRTRLINSELNL